MGEKVILILCHSREMILDGPDCLSYDEPPPKGFLFEEGKGFDELKKMLIDELGAPREGEELEITYRCPATSTPSSAKFKPLLLRNDKDVKFMITVATLSQLPSVELYIKRSETLESQFSTEYFERFMESDVPREFLSSKGWEDSYLELPKWMNKTIHMNKGTQVQWDLTPTDICGRYKFKRVFWSFGAAIEGFKYCRPLIQIDGIMLLGKYKGHLLVATSIDSDGHIYPLAYAVVEEENSDSWSWFLSILRIRVTQRDGICLISNMHEGILSVVNDFNSGWKEPDAYHRLCLEHVATKFDEKYGSKDLKDLVYHAGRQHQKHKYEQCMNELKQLNLEYLNFFTHVREEKWAQSYDNGYRYGCLTTNLLECLTEVLMGVRELPITALVQLTFHRSVSIFAKRRMVTQVALSKGELYTKYALEKIHKWKERASTHKVVKLDEVNENFEVVTGQNKQMVRLKDKTCTCNKWQSFGIPCSHAISVCLHCHLDYGRFVEDYYKLSVYLSCYSPQFHPIIGDTRYVPNLDFMIVHPDQYCIGDHAHSSTSRVHNEMGRAKASSKTRCGLCKQEGHNRRNCPIPNKDASSCTNNHSRDLFFPFMS